MSRPQEVRGLRKSPAERSAEITAAACALALDEGLSAVTLRAVAARAQVTPALVAHYAEGMDALVARAFEVIVSAEVSELEELTAGRRPPEQLQLLLGTLLDGSRSDVTLVWVEAWALGRRNELLASSVREQMDAWQAVLLRILESGVATGDFTIEDPPAASWLLLGLVDGFTAQSLVRWGGMGDRGDAVARAVAAIVGLPSGALSVGF